MSLIAAVDTAVRLQLAQTKPSEAQTYSKKMGTAPGFGFDLAGMMDFLEQVANRLRIDTPPLKYDWARSDPQKFLDNNLAMLVRLIAADTGSV